MKKRYRGRAKQRIERGLGGQSNGSRCHYQRLATYKSALGIQIIEYGIIRRDHELVPAQYQQKPTGMYITFVVSDVDVVYKKAVEMGLPIIQEPRNEFYGQRRFLTQDPNGCLIDICSPWEAE